MFWVRTAPSSFPKDADNRTIPADNAASHSGTPLPADISVSAALPQPGACECVIIGTTQEKLDFKRVSGACPYFH